MRSSLVFGLSLLLLAGCAHKSTSTATATLENFQIPENYHQQLEQKLAADLMADAPTARKPANAASQVQILKAQLGDLNKVKPGKFEIYVFPKLNSTTHKEIGEKETVLGKPQVSEVSVLAVSPCNFFIKKNGFSKYSPKQYFDAKLAQSLKNQCAIVEVSSREMKKMNRSLLREGDVMAKRLYLDGQYNVYGIETDYYSKSAKQKQNNMKTVGFKMSAGTPATSGLDFLPVDMPALGSVEKLSEVSPSSVFSLKSAKGDFTFKSGGTLVDGFAVRQITQVNKNFKIPACSMKKITYKDFYRKPVDMYWCQGLPWPQVVESLQFVAVTQNLTVR